MKKWSQQSKSIRASEVLDVSEKCWQERPWSQRRELTPSEEAFCDRAASQILACLAQTGAAQPLTQRFLKGPSVEAWSGDFTWGKVWCASRGEEFWAWAQGAGTSNARAEIAGSVSMWDEDLADAFAQSLGENRVEKV